MSKKAAAIAAKAHEKWQAEYARLSRIKVRSRATLIVCPLSTVVNWEDQFKEHWAGEVQVIGGACTGVLPQEGSMSEDHKQSEDPGCETVGENLWDALPCSSQSSTPGKSSLRASTPFRVYIYHGNARRPEPDFLADFDAVITTYSTLASEYSRQCKSLVPADSEENLGDESGEGSVSGMLGDMEGEELKRQAVLKKGIKRKKAFCNMIGGTEMCSPLQSIHWFRIVLDEAQ
jgi:SNF2 family DNA or RNA helicase